MYVFHIRYGETFDLKKHPQVSTCIHDGYSLISRLSSVCVQLLHVAKVIDQCTLVKGRAWGGGHDGHSYSVYVEYDTLKMYFSVDVYYN